LSASDLIVILFTDFILRIQQLMRIRRNSRAVRCGYFREPAFGLRLPGIDKQDATRLDDVYIAQ
jgi:hypothetical protein